MRSRTIPILVVLIVAALPALADDPPDPISMRGEVVQVRQRSEAGGQPVAEIRVRTRERREAWVRLGPAAEVEGRFRVGDRVRVEGRQAGADGAVMASRVLNRSTGERIRLGEPSGTATRQRQRDRIHRPSSAASSEAGRRGGGGRRGR